MKKLIALLLAMTMLFALVACGSDNADTTKTDEGTKTDVSSTDKSAGETEDKTGEEEKAEEPRFTPIEDLVVYQRQGEEMGTFNILYTQSFKELMPLTNCVDALLSNDNYAQIIPGLAESWEASADCITYTSPFATALPGWITRATTRPTSSPRTLPPPSSGPSTTTRTSP